MGFSVQLREIRVKGFKMVLAFLRLFSYLRAVANNMPFDYLLYRTLQEIKRVATI